MQPSQSEIESLRTYLREFQGGQWSGHAECPDAELADAIARAKQWIGGRRWSWHTVARNILEDGYPHA